MQTQKTIFFLTAFSFCAVQLPMQALRSFHHPQEALDIAAEYLPDNPVIIEAGAYDGVDSVAMAKKWSHSTIHCFEPIPYLYATLSKTIAGQSNVHSYNCAVGDSVGSATMYVSELPSRPGIPSESSSLLAPKEHLTYSNVQFKDVITVPVTTFDAWAEQHGVDHVDLMWLDMQGYELNALMASPKIMSTVRVILTEVEFVEAYENQYQFVEVKRWLEGQGFVMIAQNNYCHWFGDVMFVRKEYVK